MKDSRGKPSIIILGPQGSGKGTQASLLQEKFHYVVIGAGDSLREIAKTDTELGRQVFAGIHKGQLVPPEIIAQTIKAKLAHIPKEQRVILEGFPRTIEQYKLMKEFWGDVGRGDYQAIFLELSEHETIKRLSRRLVCEQCGKNYMEGSAKLCLVCGGKLIRRHDDEPDAIRQRLQLFNAETLPLIKEFEREGKLIRIDGSLSIDPVNQEIVAALKLE